MDLPDRKPCLLFLLFDVAVTFGLGLRTQTFNREWAYVRITGLGYQVDRAKKLLLINTIEATQQEARNGDFGGRGERSNNGGGGHDGDDGNSGANQPRRNRNRNGNTGNNGNNGNNNNGNENSGNGGRGRRSPGRGRGRGRDRQPRQ